MPRFIRATVLALCLAQLLSGPALARSLESFIGRPLQKSTTIASISGSQLSEETNGATEELNDKISNALRPPMRAAQGQLPVASASASFTYEYDPKLDLFVRSTDTLGPLFAERTQTLGKGKFAVSSAYTHVDYNRLNGQNLNSYKADVPLGQRLINSAGGSLPGLEDDFVSLTLDLGIKSDSLFFFFTYGVLDRLDVGIALPIKFVTVNGNYDYEIHDQRDSPSGPGLNQFVFLQDCESGQETGCDIKLGRRTVKAGKTATTSFDQSRQGVGDIFLRTKYRFLESEYVDAAGAFTLTIPTGGADDFLGFEHVTGTPLLILSKSFDWIAPHFNAGFAFRDSQDVGQAIWAVGTEVRAFSWLTVVPDFLGFHDVIRAGSARDDVFQSSLGFKVNPFGQYVAGFNLQFPLNRDQGLRADVIYSVQIEATF